MNLSVILAIFKRNFFSYFANPTGYVFICAFVLVSGFAAFWPHEFFNANLANLDQLNKFIPFIMLGFIPAITMSIWADERRQGTDELLLTLPASDLDVVLGKYKAAVAIFTVSLLFSLSNVIVLGRLGDPDVGLLLANYVGYWLVGLAMLAIGMVASFLTGNLTVGFVLGVALNAPLVFFANADTFVSQTTLVQHVREWSIGRMFEDFGRGVISLGGIVYFLSIAAIGLYLCMILIGRRHWVTGKAGGSMLGHFIVRAIAVLVIAVGLTVVLRTKDVRIDTTSEKLSSLSPETEKLLRGMGDKKVTVEAYISPESEMPEAYIKTRLELIGLLNEIQARSGGRVSLNIQDDIEAYKPEATIADQRFGIKPQTRFSRDRQGKFKQQEIFMGVAMMSGLDKEVIPFFDRGVPAEYELIRSIVALSQEKKKSLGVVRTDAPLLAQPMNPMMMMQQPPQEEALITELRKQYEVLEVDALGTIEKKYDVLLVVQPSSLDQAGVDNIVKAIKAGQPTVILEDPVPLLWRGQVAGTSDEKQPRAPMRGMPPPPAGPKANLAELWKTLGVNLTDATCIAQDWNPFPKISEFPPTFVFAGKGSDARMPFNVKDGITSGLQHVMFLCPGAITKQEGGSTTVTALITTGPHTGAVKKENVFERDESNPFGREQLAESPRAVALGQEQVLAARITGAAETGGANLNVVLVADIDLIGGAFFNVRNQGENEVMGAFLDVDNVTLALNMIDSLSGDERFLDIRKRRRIHRTLTAFEKSTEQARLDSDKAVEEFRVKFDDEVKVEEKKINDRIAEIRKEFQSGEIDEQQANIKVNAAAEQLNKTLTVKREQLRQQRDAQIKKAESELELTIRQLQNHEKRLAVFVPPILPLLIAGGVFFWRRSRELEGAVKSRVRG